MVSQLFHFPPIQSAEMQSAMPKRTSNADVGTVFIAPVIAKMPLENVKTAETLFEAIMVETRSFRRFCSTAIIFIHFLISIFCWLCVLVNKQALPKGKKNILNCKSFFFLYKTNELKSNLFHENFPM